MAEGVAIHEVVFDQTGAAVNYRIIDVNPQYELFTGLKPAQVLGKLANEVYGTSEPPYLSEFSAVALSGRPGHLETYFAPLARHYEISIAPVAYGYFATLFSDVTERKAHEQALRESEWFLQQSQRVGHLGSYRFDIVAGTWAGSRALDEVFGIDASFRKTVEGWLSLISHEDREMMGRYLAQDVVVEGKTFDRRYRIVRPNDGQVRWVHGYGELEKDEKGSPLYMIGTIQDITDAMRAEQERRRLEEQLQQSQKLESVGRLAGGVAHDFNNLLTVIMSCADSLLASDVLVADDRSDASDIADAARRAADLTRQLLAFSRQQVLQPRVIALSEVVGAAGRMLRRLLGEDIDLVVTGSDHSEKVFADPGQLEQILVNLAVNARDAMPSGGKLTIETSSIVLNDAFAAEHLEVTPGEYVMLAVSDTGIGMDEQTRARAFDPFFTTKSATGTGLGLATVYGIVKQSGGHIWLYSELGAGSTIKIYLPRAYQTSARPSSLRPAVLRRGDETILLVEDEDRVRLTLQRVLVNAGYTVMAAANAEEALALCQKRGQAIDLLLTDVVMPKMTGLQLAERIAAMQPATRVLYMSGYAPNSIVHHGVLEEGIEFIQKPLTPASLLAKVREVLDG